MHIKDLQVIRTLMDVQERIKKIQVYLFVWVHIGGRLKEQL